MWSKALVVSLCVFCFGTLAVTAFASRAPTSFERRAILRAAPANPYPAGWAHRTVRVSTVNRRWAAVEIVADPGHTGQVQPDVASMYRTRSGRWIVHQPGNGGGCGVPRRVKEDLHLACY